MWLQYYISSVHVYVEQSNFLEFERYIVLKFCISPIWKYNHFEYVLEVIQKS